MSNLMDFLGSGTKQKIEEFTSNRTWADSRRHSFYAGAYWCADAAQHCLCADVSGDHAQRQWPGLYCGVGAMGACRRTGNVSDDSYSGGGRSGSRSGAYYPGVSSLPDCGYQCTE